MSPAGWALAAPWVLLQTPGASGPADRPSEDEMFGGPPSAPASAPAPSSEAAAPAAPAPAPASAASTPGADARRRDALRRAADARGHP
jgi:hypothetical protein